MRARGEVAAVVLSIMLVGAGASLLVPRWALGNQGAPREVARTPAASPKVVVEPRLHVEPAKDDAGRAVQVASLRDEAPEWERFAARALVPLTPDERALLQEEPVDDLAVLVTRTERAFMDATPEARVEKERRYLAALNLVAKLATLPEPSAEDLRAREVDARYQQALTVEQVKWRSLPPEEKARQHDAFKEAFFRAEETR
ncbi:hypothetical protein BHS06_31825 [Myxococcus xanthus]|uniref:hypothetical protein n=1 Tax=Myxococcus xanthus TaxID=34 RepID=UPI00112E6661|nr:hypothetical protein [Myxococcus xanthus]QDE93209.1 hypothetical protein BHS06_31825 [Myxococcus xanthus]